jgi:predicted nuclease of predicted toxin-antitoxin system
MRLYLDDDMASPTLQRLLSQAGHDVVLPIDVAMDGASDTAHLTFAVANRRLVLTGNHDDFEELHELVLQVQGHHPGILCVRRDNNPRRDLSAGGIVRALANLIAAGILVTDQFIVLNHWR